MVIPDAVRVVDETNTSQVRDVLGTLIVSGTRLKNTPM